MNDTRYFKSRTQFAIAFALLVVALSAAALMCPTPAFGSTHGLSGTTLGSQSYKGFKVEDLGGGVYLTYEGSSKTVKVPAKVNGKVVVGCDVSGKGVESIDVSKVAWLQDFRCDNNELAKLDVSKNKKLKELVCQDNRLTRLDLPKNGKLREIWCDRNKLTKLDVSKNKKLKCLYCQDNKLAKLDVSKNGKLKCLYCQDNKLAKLDVSKNKELEAFHWEGKEFLRHVITSKNANALANTEEATSSNLVTPTTYNSPSPANTK